MSYFGRSPQLVSLTTLPAAGSNVGRIMMQGGKAWFSDGASWLDMTVAGSATYAALNNVRVSGAGPTLTLTEATIGSTATLNNVQPSSTVMLIARCNPVKDASTTVRQATFRVRRGTTNTDPQIGADSAVESTAVASTPFGGSAVIIGFDSGHGGGTLNYTLRGLATVTAVVTTPVYELIAIELKGIKGDTGPTGPTGPTASPIDLIPPIGGDVVAPTDLFLMGDMGDGGQPGASRKITGAAVVTMVNNAMPNGIYTPSAGNVANCASFGTHYGQYIRVGDIVFFTLQLTVTPTTANVLTSMTVSLPIASTFASTLDCFGVASSNAANNGAFVVRCDTATNKIFVSYTPTVVTAQGIRVSGSYLVQ